MIRVRDLAYVGFSAPALEAMERFATDVGMALTAREDDAIDHRGTDPSSVERPGHIVRKADDCRASRAGYPSSFGKQRLEI